jgi:hypothetical protein
LIFIEIVFRSNTVGEKPRTRLVFNIGGHKYRLGTRAKHSSRSIDPVAWCRTNRSLIKMLAEPKSAFSSAGPFGPAYTALQSLRLDHIGSYPQQAAATNSAIQWSSASPYAQMHRNHNAPFAPPLDQILGKDDRFHCNALDVLDHRAQVVGHAGQAVEADHRYIGRNAQAQVLQRADGAHGHLVAGAKHCREAQSRFPSPTHAAIAAQYRKTAVELELRTQPDACRDHGLPVAGAAIQIRLLVTGRAKIGDLAVAQGQQMGGSRTPAAEVVFVFMGIWNEFMKPLLFISSVDRYLLTQGLNAVAKQYAKATSWNLIMAGSIISVLPILFLFIVLNKYFVTLNDQSSGGK